MCTRELCYVSKRSWFMQTENCFCADFSREFEHSASALSKTNQYSLHESHSLDMLSPHLRRFQGASPSCHNQSWWVESRERWDNHGQERREFSTSPVLPSLPSSLAQQCSRTPANERTTAVFSINIPRHSTRSPHSEAK